MRRSDFEAMVRRLSEEVPAHFFEGVAEVVVSPRTVPHPERPDIYTLGECVPLPAEGGSNPEDVQSRIVLYYGSFAALARLEPGFAWRDEAWETLAHELRHHLEWRARAPTLEAFDAAVEANYARHDGEPFDPLFYRDGEPHGEGVYQVEDDWFVERVVRHLPSTVELDWGGERYRVRVPPDARLPCFLTVEGVDDPPPGELVLVLRPTAGVRTLFRRSRPPYQGTAPVDS